MLDHFSGWTVPRHLYTEKIYQVWGAMPYEDGDYLTHSVLSMLYPGYEDASYFRDERGFLSPTPYGDLADCLLTDAAPWVLRQYGLVILAGGLTRAKRHEELRDNLTEYAEAGGRLVITAENARTLWPEWSIGEGETVPGGEDRPLRGRSGGRRTAWVRALSVRRRRGLGGNRGTRRSPRCGAEGDRCGRNHRRAQPLASTPNRCRRPHHQREEHELPARLPF